jgi:hypothetical protein
LVPVLLVSNKKNRHQLFRAVVQVGFDAADGGSDNAEQNRIRGRKRGTKPTPTEGSEL